MDSTTARIGNLILSSPISQALEILGDRWSFLTLRDLFLGRHRFGEFVTSTGASRSTLANRLNTLQAHGLVYKTLYHENPPRYEYRLSEKGLALYNFALAIWAWETRWSGNPTSVMPIQLYHEPCANHFLPKPICSHCGSEVHIKAVSTRPGSSLPDDTLAKSSRTRRSRMASDKAQNREDSMLETSELLADRWTPLVLAATLYGLRRYDDIRNELSIATNILADRLERLVAHRMLSREQYQDNPPRYEYRLTEKARDYFIIAIALHQWSEQWLNSPGLGATIMSHSCCDAPIRVDMCCDHCMEAVKPHDVSYSHFSQ